MAWELHVSYLFIRVCVVTSKKKGRNKILKRTKIKEQGRQRREKKK